MDKKAKLYTRLLNKIKNDFNFNNQYLMMFKRNKSNEEHHDDYHDENNDSQNFQEKDSRNNEYNHENYNNELEKSYEDRKSSKKDDKRRSSKKDDKYIRRDPRIYDAMPYREARNYYDDKDQGFDSDNRYYDHNDRRGYRNDDYDDYDDIDTYNPPKQSNQSKGFTWSVMGSILGSLVIGGAIAGIAVYVMNNRDIRNNTPSISNGELRSFYRTSSNEINKEAMKYIFSRTLSIQFIYANASGRAASISGTAWIFNKGQNSDNYYLATNLHVAAGLTYSNASYDPEDPNFDFSGFSLSSTYIGFIDNNDVTYSSKDLNFLKINTPEVVYTATEDKDDSGLGQAFPQLNSISGNSGKKYAVDFSVLKFNFSNDALIKNNSTAYQGNLENVTKFKNWLKYYDAKPTEFYTSPITNIQQNSTSANPGFNKKYFMGGFPGTGNSRNNNSYSGSYSTSGTNYLNFGGTSWEGFGNFPLAIKNTTDEQGSINKLDRISNITASEYNVYASSGYTTYLKNPNQAFGITYFDSPNSPTSYVNVGYNALIDASSLGGSSGSMIIINDPTSSEKYNFKVVAIYWGEIQFSDSKLSQTQTNTNTGVGNFLYVADNAMGNKTKGYNIFEYALNTIKKSESSLVYNPDFTK